MLELEGKTVIVTGAARGLGRSYALAIAREGATVVLTDRDAVELEEVKSVIDASGGRARTVCVDLSNPDSASKILDFAYEGSEVVDGLVNNAATMTRGNLDTTTRASSTSVTRLTKQKKRSWTLFPSTSPPSSVWGKASRGAGRVKASEVQSSTSRQVHRWEWRIERPTVRVRERCHR